MLPGKELDLGNMFLTQTSAINYQELCKLDVLGLKDKPSGDQETVCEEFKEQLTRSSEAWYETSLPWKGNHPPLPNNRTGSLKRLETLVCRLERRGQLERYDGIIQDKLNQGIVERADEAGGDGKKFYIPHKAVVRENAETTKMRIVHDASARESPSAASLNECLEVGTTLQKQLWSVMIRNRFYPVAIAGDLKQAFLQIRVRGADRDALRFHWVKDLRGKQVETLRFTRVLFGLAPSLFLLAAVIKEHLQRYKSVNPKLVEEIECSMYVDDLITGGELVKQALEVKQTAQTIFNEATFELHKWQSNVQDLEADDSSPDEEGQTYAKQQLGAKKGEPKLLGVPWNKEKDKIQVSFPTFTAEPSKRVILAKIAKVYDPLGLASPVSLSEKALYREACDTRSAWDNPLATDLKGKWNKWEQSLPEHIEIARSVVKHEEKILSIDLHAFGDASGKGVSAAVYAVMEQPSGMNQGLVTAKSGLSKKGLTIPRLELVSGHMSTNLLYNVKEGLEGFPVREVYGWLDSTVALHWIRGNGEYKQFVGNRVKKIQEKQITWRHVPTEENRADMGSRGGEVNKLTTHWWRGPSWLSQPQDWPPDRVTASTQETEAEEVKQMREVFALAVEKTNKANALDELLEKHELWRVLRNGAWIVRFLRNTRTNHKNRVVGPLTTEEIEKQTAFWIEQAQQQANSSKQFEEDRLLLKCKQALWAWWTTEYLRGLGERHRMKH